MIPNQLKITHQSSSTAPSSDSLARLPAEILVAVIQHLNLDDQLRLSQINRRGRVATTRALRLQAPSLVFSIGVTRQPSLELLFDPRLDGPRGRALLAHHWECDTSTPLVRQLKYQLEAFDRVSLPHGLNPLSWARQAGLPMRVATWAMEFATGQKISRHPRSTDWSPMERVFKNNPGVLADVWHSWSSAQHTDVNLFFKSLVSAASLQELLAWREYNPPHVNRVLFEHVLKDRDLFQVGLPLLSNRRPRDIIGTKELDWRAIVRLSAQNKHGISREFMLKFANAANKDFYKAD